MQAITIDLPFPVSQNMIWAQGRGRTFKSPVYKKWLKEAGLLWITQRRHQPIQSIEGPFSAYVILRIRDNRRRDIDNLSKILLDFAQRHSIISDDKLCRRLLVEVGTDETAPLGARLILKPM